MIILLLLVALASAATLAKTIRNDGYGTRQGPRSPTDADRRP
ncbi:MAG: hypothetical protein ABWY58_13770 [Aeromicrobium sp.]